MPERWLEKKRLPVCSYLPFAAGSRKCIGQMFAKLEAKSILAGMLHKFNVSLQENSVIVPELSLTMRPKYGVQAILTPRI